MHSYHDGFGRRLSAAHFGVDRSSFSYRCFCVAAGHLAIAFAWVRAILHNNRYSGDPLVAVMGDKSGSAAVTRPIWDEIKFVYRCAMLYAWFVGLGAHGIIAANSVGDPIVPAIVITFLSGFFLLGCRDWIRRRVASFNVRGMPIQEFSSSSDLLKTIDVCLVALAIATFIAFAASFSGFMLSAESVVTYSQQGLTPFVVVYGLGRVLINSSW